MAQILQTREQGASDKTAAGFLTALGRMTGAEGQSAESGLFASLLSQTQSALFEVERAAPAATRSQEAENPFSSQEERSSSCSVGQEGAQDEGLFEESKRPRVSEIGGSGAPASEPSRSAAVAAEAKACVVTNEAAEGASEKEEETQEVETALDGLEAVLALLLPFQDKDSRAIAVKATDAPTAKTDAEAVPSGVQEENQSLEETLAKMEAIRQALTQEREGQPEDSVLEEEVAARAQGLIDKTLEGIEEKIIAFKDLQPKAVGEKKEGGAQTLAFLGLETKEGGGEEKGASTLAPVAQDALPFSQEDLPYTPAAPKSAGTGASAQGLGQAASFALSGVTANSGEAASTASSGTSPLVAQTAVGARSVGSYDVASHLVASARAGKAGSSGLPQAVEQVAVQLHRAVKDGADTLTIQLKPAELGKIEIKLEIGADKSVTGTVVAENQAALTLLQKDSASLQRALQEAGLQANAGCLEFSLRDQQGQSGQFANASGGEQGQTEGQKAHAERAFGQDTAGEGQTESYILTPGRVNLSV